MKREEAESIWGMISAVYGLHPERSGEQAVVWVPALEEMNAETVMGIVTRWMKGDGPEKLPTLVMFAADVKAIERRAEPSEYRRGHDCDLCDDHGLVTVAKEKPDGYGDALAPCPSCDRGKQHEFPLDKEGAWGSEGFWRGRRWEQVGYQEVGIVD